MQDSLALLKVIVNTKYSFLISNNNIDHATVSPTDNRLTEDRLDVATIKHF